MILCVVYSPLFFVPLRGHPLMCQYLFSPINSKFGFKIKNYFFEALHSHTASHRIRLFIVLECKCGLYVNPDIYIHSTRVVISQRELFSVYFLSILSSCRLPFPFHNLCATQSFNNHLNGIQCCLQC